MPIERNATIGIFGVMLRAFAFFEGLRFCALNIFFVNNRFVKSPATCKVIAFKAVACKYSASDIRAKPRMAMYINGFILWNFIYS